MFRIPDSGGTGWAARVTANTFPALGVGKEKPVVAGKAVGIPMQYPEGFDANLVESLEACAERVIAVLRQAGERGVFGRAGREHGRRHFLLPRVVRNEVRLIQQLIS